MTRAKKLCLSNFYLSQHGTERFQDGDIVQYYDAHIWEDVYYQPNQSRGL